METHLLEVNNVEEKDDNHDDDDDDVNYPKVMVATFTSNWRNYVTTSGINTCGILSKSWQQSPTCDAARRMYDAEIKLRYYNKDTTKKFVDYKHLKKMLGGAMLGGHEQADDDNNKVVEIRGVIKYIITDENQHPSAAQFKFQNIK
ncbi:hypothetical protein JTB14_011253 [Gonioctena quinquepunctata]|nr:hypothetical protein JTB14_011253 [Gonioctena quinquepunctata]